MVETGFKKNRTMVVSDVGERPVRMFGDNVAGGMNLYSRAAPGWTLSLTNTKTVNGILSAHVTLDKNGRFIGGGDCLRPTKTAATISATVGDLGTTDENRNAPRRLAGAASARKARPDEVATRLSSCRAWRNFVSASSSSRLEVSVA